MDGLTDLLLGVDVGTTRTKAAVVDAAGRELSWGSVPTRWHQVATGAETSAQGLLGGVLQAIDAALQSAPPGRVVGAGVTSMAETAVFLDDDGRPTAPSIVWHDSRGEEEGAALEEAFGSRGFAHHTGLPASALCTVAKLKWLSGHGQVAPTRILSVADWVVYALGGEQASEGSLASRTGALDVPGRRWWEEPVQWAGVPRSAFAPLVQAGASLGKARLDRASEVMGASDGFAGPSPSFSTELQRLEGAALTSAGHDHLCAAVGAGVTSAAQVLDSCGTAEAFVRAVARLDGDALVRAVEAGLCVSWHIVPGHDVLLVGSPLGMVLDRLLHLLGVTGAEAVSRLDQRAGGVQPGRLRVVSNGFFEDPSVLGLHAEVSPEALWTAALDEVSSHAARDLRMTSNFGSQAEELVLSGGWARCAGLRRRRRGLLPRLRWPDVTEAGARGAALFGGCAAGLFANPAGFPAPLDRLLSPA